MVQQKKWQALAAFLACWASCSYSEQYIYGTSINAATGGLVWNMDSILPQETSLVVNGVVYRYTAVKDPSDPMLVSVQNKNANGSGYIFREVDDWSGLPGNTINKLIAVDDIPLSSWGEGSIEVQGNGTVEDASVVYTYRYEPCTINCGGSDVVVEIPTYDIYDATNDSAVKDSMRETDPDLYDRDNKKNKKSSKEDEKLEKALAANESALEIAGQVSQEAIIQSMNGIVSMNTYYAANINGGTYTEVLTLPTTDIPDNKSGLRNNLAQQLLHQQMVDSQYEN